MKFKYLAAFAACFPMSAAAETRLSFNSGYFQSGDAQWEGYTYSARDLVGSLNGLSADLTDWGHDRLGLGAADPQARLIYLLSAGFLNFRFQFANSVVFGHELVHWQHARRFGLTDHYFLSSDGASISLAKMYLDTFVSGSAKHTAVSRQEGNFNAPLYQLEGIETTLHALNWQTSYSEEWLKDAMFYNDKTVFDVSDVILNRLYLTSYAMGDYRRKNASNGDMHKYASHIAPDADRQDTLAKITMISLGAALLSPGIGGAFVDLGEYVSAGDTRYEVKGFDALGGRYFWDVPTYINETAYTVAPTLYLLADDALSHSVGADRLLLSGGLEVAAIGESDAELRIGARAYFGATEIDANLTSNGDAHFAELEVGYNLGDHFEIYAGAAVADGRNLRARRNLPEGGDTIWMGTRLRF